MTHHAAVIDRIGRHLADREFPATIRGYRDLLDWMRSHGTLAAVEVEGTGAYGAELARILAAAGVTVIDVDRPDHRTRRMKTRSTPTPLPRPCLPDGPRVSPRAGTVWSRRCGSCGSLAAARSRPVPRRVTTRQQWFTRVPSSRPHLTPLPTPSPPRSPRRSSANAAWGGLGTSLHRATPKGQDLHHPCSTTSDRSSYIELSFTSRTHGEPHSQLWLARTVPLTIKL
ncbi:IS110 family transposase [Streptomyces sp. NPDC001719]